MELRSLLYDRNVNSKSGVGNPARLSLKSWTATLNVIKNSL